MTLVPIIQASHGNPRYLAAAWLLLAGLMTPTVDGATPEELRFFEERVRPLLVEKCQSCHGAEKQKGGLRLDSRAAVELGGDSGPPAVAGKPDESLLVEAIKYESLEMPPDARLPDEEVAVLVQWIRMGMPWPDDAANVKVRGPAHGLTDEDRAYWAFQPLKTVQPPTVDDHGWSRNEIDRFIFQRLQSEGIVPGSAAEKRILIRRLNFDLTGLPPTPEEIDAFVRDSSPQAYDRLVDRLLDSPQYGEKWARHWLDLVRYAESDGFKQDAYRPQAWRYRDYVVQAFNDDKPYDRFIMEQLAGDEIAPHDLDALAATSYLRHWIYEYNQRDVRTQWSNILNDVTDVTAEVFLGLSVGCARCHDHKFDPILRKDYYRFQAFFAALLPRDDIPLLAPGELEQYRQQWRAWQDATAAIRREIEEIERPIRETTAAAAINKFPPDVRPFLGKAPETREPLERQLADLAFRQVAEEYEKLDFAAKLKGEAKEKWQALNEQLKEHETRRPTPPANAFTVSDVGPVAPVTFIPSDRTRRPIAPGFLSVLDPSDAVIPPHETGVSTGRRTALAQWIASPENPLTSRVIVNRVWQYHFGQGIVTTVSDLGHLGDPPSHPELLDWLARWFIDHGWSFKKLHRLIVTSATYQQAALVEPTDIARQKDPDNRWLWRMPIRRLHAEEIRDAALAASGELVVQSGGPSVEPTQPRRTIYTKVVRNVRDPLLDVFDAPDNFNSTAVRNVTTTPTQALLMINGNWMLERARRFAERLEKETQGDPAEMVNRAIYLAYGRTATEEEFRTGVAFLAGSSVAGQPSIAPPSSTAAFAPFPNRSGTALNVGSPARHLPVMATNAPALPAADFTVEAFILLRSLHDDASVRTIVSQWDSDARHPGWSLGVTSKRSRYEPRNLILQLVGTTKEGLGYEVIPSNLRLELNRPYYVAVTVRIADASGKGVTFHVRDLSVENAPLQSVSMPHKVIKDYRGSQALVIGGRHGNDRHQWDGLIDDVRLTNDVLSSEKLLVASTDMHSGLVGMWRFESEGGFLHDSSANAMHLTEQASPRPVEPARSMALVDFCHVLLNSNEFLYTD